MSVPESVILNEGLNSMGRSFAPSAQKAYSKLFFTNIDARALPLSQPEGTLFGLAMVRNPQHHLQ